MSFSEPLSLTVSGVTTPLPRVSVGERKSEYLSGDGLYEIIASHEGGKTKRLRRTLRLNATKVAADPFRDDVNVERSMSFYIVFDMPPVGYSATDAFAIYTGFKTMMIASSDIMITKLLGGES